MATNELLSGETGQLPEELAPHADEWYRLCETSPHREYVKITGSLGEGIVDAIARLSSVTTKMVAGGRDGDALCELVASWRQQSREFAGNGQFDSGLSWGLAKCADELEAAASDQPAT